MKKREAKVREGEPDQVDKVLPQEGTKFGVSKGITRNMGNYESLRVDVWMTSEPEEGETIREAFDRVDVLLTNELENILKNTN